MRKKQCESYAVAHSRLRAARSFRVARSECLTVTSTTLGCLIARRRQFAQIRWSYRHAWGYIRRTEAVLGVSLVATKADKGAARTVVTDLARDIVFTLLPERLKSGSKMKSAMAAESTRGHNNARTTDRLHIDA
jgi:hypothetical protein